MHRSHGPDQGALKNSMADTPCGARSKRLLLQFKSRSSGWSFRVKQLDARALIKLSSWPCGWHGWHSPLCGHLPGAISAAAALCRNSMVNIGPWTWLPTFKNQIGGWIGRGHQNLPLCQARSEATAER